MVNFELFMIMSVIVLFYIPCFNSGGERFSCFYGQFA